MPHLPQKLHRRRREGIIPREAQLSGKDAVLVWRAVGPLDQRFPEEDVVFRDGACGDAVGGVGGQVLVFGEEAFGGQGGGHCGVWGRGGLLRGAGRGGEGGDGME